VHDRARPRLSRAADRQTVSRPARPTSVLVHDESNASAPSRGSGVAPRAALRPSPSLLIRLAALLWLVVHFGLTVAYVTPLNPLTVLLQPLLNATIGTYFSQGWGFFAPNPGASVA